MNVHVTRPAQTDIDQAIAFIARDSPQAAARWLGDLLALFGRLASGELNGTETRLLDGRRAQRWPMPPFRIYYRRSARRTVIVRVHHGARRPIE